MRLPQYKTWYGGKMHRWGIFETKNGTLEFIPPIDLRAPQLENTVLKDKNGKEIYEGDVIKASTNSHHSNSDIYWDAHYSCFRIRADEDEDGYTLNKYYCENEYEIIGNIYENPDLLKKPY